MSTFSAAIVVDVLGELGEGTWGDNPLAGAACFVFLYPSLLPKLHSLHPSSTSASCRDAGLIFVCTKKLRAPVRVPVCCGFWPIITREAELVTVGLDCVPRKLSPGPTFFSGHHQLRRQLPLVAVRELSLPEVMSRSPSAASGIPVFPRLRRIAI
jgi:hypothetical protein